MTHPGPFYAEHWDEDEYVVTCAIGPIGQTLSQHDAVRIARWLNTAIPELLRKLDGQPTPEEEQP